MRRPSLAIAIAMGAVIGFAAPADALDAIRLITGVTQPVWVGAPEGDSRIFVVEKTGYIEIFDQDGSYIGQFLNIDPRVASVGEQGLFTVLFDENYDTTGAFYVNYTNNSGDTVISRFFVSSSDPNDADETSEQILLTIGQPFSNHNGGRMCFGPNDGYLYIGTGDGGSGGDPSNYGQRVNTLLGKILRIDVSDLGLAGYTIPTDNPFVDEPAALNEIWATGVRNPWGMDFDPASGDLYWADVGQFAWEEVNVQPRTSAGGENWGWRVMEGFHCFNPSSGCDMSDKTLPVHEYSHSGGRCSITGGIVYRGSIPEIDGLYFFADYCSDDIWSFEWDGAGGILNLINRTADLDPDVGTIGSITAISRDGLGEMYICDQGGEVFKVVADVVDTPDTVPPTPALLKVTPNPFRKSVRFELGVSTPDEAVVTVFDIRGAAVRTWARGTVTSQLVWDGHDDAGRELTAGVYYVQVEIGEAKSRSRVTLLR